MTGYGYGYGHHGIGILGFGWILMFVVWALVIIGVIFLVKWLVAQDDKTKTAAAKPENSPLDILRERYAKGEVDKEEFEQKKKDLS
jgi:putative membrane protein